MAQTFYSTTTIQAAGVISATHELLTSDSAGSGTTTEEVRKNSVEDVIGFVVHKAPYLGHRLWPTGTYVISVNLTAFPSGLQLLSDIGHPEWRITNDSWGATHPDSPFATGTDGSWDSTTGTGTKVWTGTSINPTPDSQTAALDRATVVVEVQNTDTKNNLSVTFTHGSSSYVQMPDAPALAFAWVCGVECQVHDASFGTVTQSGFGPDGGHYISATSTGGTVSAVAAAARSGDYGLRFDTSGGAATNWLRVTNDGFGRDGTVAYGRFYFKVDRTGVTTNIIQVTGTNGADFYVNLNSGTLRFDADGTFSSTNNLTTAADTWYGVEFEIELVAANNAVSKWRVWTEAGGWTTSETVNASPSDDVFDDLIDIGLSTTAAAVVLDFDDMAFNIGYVGGEYYDDTSTNGVDARVLRYSPVSDGTHGFSTSGDFDYYTGGSNTGGISPTATDVWSYLDTPDMDLISDGVQRDTATTSEYIECNFGDESTEDGPRGVLLVVNSLASGSAPGNRFDISDDGTNWLELQNMSSPSGPSQAVRALATSPDGATWTRTLLNGMRFRYYGLSDVADFLHNAALEVEWTDLAAGPVTGSFTVDADLQATMSGSFATDAVIQVEQTGSFTVDANKQIHTDASFAADAIVLATMAGAATADAVVLATQVGTFSLDAVVQTTPTASFATDAILLVPQPGTVTANAVVERTIEAASSADAILSREVQAGFSLDAWLALATGTVTGDFTADAVVLVPQSGTTTLDALVLASPAAAFTADANIAGTVSSSFTLDAQVAGASAGVFSTDAVVSLVGACVWVSPANLSGITPTPTLVFRMPEASGNMHFQIELDTDSGFSDPTVVQSPGPGWQYWDGGGWQAVPDGGVPNTYSGNEARYTVQSPLSQATWYRRVRAGVI